MFGLGPYTKDGRRTRMKKPTMSTSKSPNLLNEQTFPCYELHAHQHITENHRKDCGGNPLELVHAIPPPKA